MQILRSEYVYTVDPPLHVIRISSDELVENLARLQKENTKGGTPPNLELRVIAQCILFLTSLFDSTALEVVNEANKFAEFLSQHNSSPNQSKSSLFCAGVASMYMVNELWQMLPDKFRVLNRTNPTRSTTIAILNHVSFFGAHVAALKKIFFYEMSKCEDYFYKCKFYIDCTQCLTLALPSIESYNALVKYWMTSSDDRERRIGHSDEYQSKMGMNRPLPPGPHRYKSELRGILKPTGGLNAAY